MSRVPVIPPQGIGSPGSSGAINIPDDYFFTDTTARDAYFTSNPTKLVEGAQVVVGNTTLQLQEYSDSAWVDITPVVRGPTGVNGADGTNGSNGVGVPTGGTVNQILSKKSGTDYDTEWQSIVRSTTAGIQFVIDGGGSVINPGSKGYLPIPFGCTVTGWSVMGDQSGSIIVDIKKCTYANFPTTASIAGTDLPTLSSTQKNSSSALTGWTTAITTGDLLEFYVNSASTVTRVTVSINITKV